MLKTVSMKPNGDPKVIFDQIRTIKSRYYCTSTQKIDEESLMAIVLGAAPKEYKAILTMELMRLQGTALDLSHLEQAMNQHYRLIKGSKPDKENVEWLS
jgi:hypothetical protein